MRARASTKTQRRLKQMQLHDPYELTGDVYEAAMKAQAQTLRVGGLVTAAGALQAVAAVGVGGYLFGPALLFCALLLVALGALGFAQLGKAAGGRKTRTRGIASRVSETLEHLRALQRGALDYSLTLSIADSAPIRDKAGRASRADRALALEGEAQWRPQVQIAVVPTRPTPQNVVAAMDMTLPPSPVTSPVPFASTFKSRKPKKQETQQLQQQRPKSASEPQPKSKAPLARDAPIARLNKVVMAPLQVPGALQRQKPKQQKPKEHVQHQQRLQPKKQQEKKSEPLQRSLPVCQQSKPKAQLEPQQTPLEPVRAQQTQQEQQPVQRDVVSAAPQCVEPVESVESVVQTSLPSLPVFPARTPIAEVARAEPVAERDVVSTRRVLLYLNPSAATAQEAQVDVDEDQQQQDWKPATAAVNVLGEEWPALTANPSTRSLSLPPSQSEAPVDDVEPNFLLDIALEAISTPTEAELTAASRLQPVGNTELHTMLTELDQMRLELDAAMASCTAALEDKHDQVTVSPLQPELELEPEVEAKASC